MLRPSSAAAALDSVAIASSRGAARRLARGSIVPAPIRPTGSADRRGGAGRGRLASGGSRVALGVWASAAGNEMIESVRQKNEENKVIVYSRSWCPYCEEVTKLLAELDVNFTLVELDHIVEGDDIQDALYDITNSTTVPQVFVGGKFVGGCDDTVSLYKSGELKSIFSGAGVESSL